MVRYLGTSILVACLVLSMALEVSADPTSDECIEFCREIRKSGYDWEKVLMGGAGAAAAIVAAPAIVASMGFGAVGVAAGSLAAKLMAMFGTTGWIGGMIAGLQSIGAAGMSLLGFGAAGTAGYKAAQLLAEMMEECECD